MRPYLVALAALAVFLLVSLRHLDAVPQVYEDEPWQASTADALAFRGVFGSTLFAGYHGMEQRYYGFVPLHPLLLGAIFRVAGTGLVQARLETVLLSALTLLLTFALGVRLFRNAWIGAVAVVVLVAVRWTGLTYIQPTGIPLVDFARIARYDPLVPVVGLAALHAYVSRRFVVSGALAGLAGLAHLYGLFWVPVLALLAVTERNFKRAVWLATAAVVVWLPYAAYVLSDVPDWRAQTAIYATRFELLDPAWYISNVMQEYHRYGPGLGPFGVGWLLRPGFWAMLVLLPASLALLGRGKANERVVLVPVLLFPTAFALLIYLKLVNYTLVELPLFALAIGYGTVRLWSSRWRLPIAIVGAAALVEGGFALARIEQAAQVTTPYPRFMTQARAYVPPATRILGLHTYWYGLQDFDFRSFLVPLNWADEGVALEDALDRVAPDTVLLDARMRAYFASVPDGQRFADWMARHHAALLGSVDDPTYGLMEIYRVDRS